MNHAGKNGEPCVVCDALTYECHWCKQRSLKHQWGPGWVRCPKCGLIAPTPFELNAMNVATFLNGIYWEPR